MDYQQEQSQELEILSCIYADDLEVLSENPFKFQIKLHYDDKMEKKVPLVIEFPEKYPSEAFHMSVELTNLLSNDEIEELIDTAKKHENIGIPVVFDTMSLIQDKIYNFSTKKSNEEKLKVEMEQVNLTKDDESTTDNIIKPKVITCDDKINGTEVTIESFCKWKIEFELEHNIDYKRSPNDGKFDPLKLTGKQFFERGMDDNATYLEIDGEMIELDDDLYVENMDDIS